MPQESNELAIQQKQQSLADWGSSVQAPFAKALARAGVTPESVTVRDVPEYIAMELEDLCNIPSARKGCKGESPAMVVTSLSLFPEADDFAGYVGYFRVEAITEDAEYIAFTHYMFREDTGEKSPLFEWVEPQTPHFALKIAHMGTRRGYSVYRPIPVALRVPTT